MIGIAYAASAEVVEHAGGGGLPQFDASTFASQGFWALVSFGLLLFLLNRYVLPGINNVLDARTEQIKNDLEKAEKNRVQSEQLLAEHRQQLADAKGTCAQVLEEARMDAGRQRDRAIADLDAELTKKKEQATQAIEQARRQAIADVQKTAVDVAVMAVEKLIAKSVSAEEAGKMVEEAITQIGQDGKRIH